jgi:cysteine desulfurase
MPEKLIYLDYNATTPIDPKVADAMLPFLYENFGNPSSSHAFGIKAKLGLELSRHQVAGMLRCKPEEVIFTSGGTESNNLAIKGAAFAYKHKGNHIITSAIEHPAILEVTAFLETQGFKVTYLPVNEFGMVDPVAVEKAITSSTILISIMHANNEVGSIQPIRAISEIAHSHNIILHTDSAQSIGKIPVFVDDLGIDLLSMAGHKLYAPKGVGVLFIREGIELIKQIHGANHERNLRAGTENVLEIVGLGQASVLVSENLKMITEHLREIRDQFEQGLKKTLPWIKINGDAQSRLPNTSSISFCGLEANVILSKLTNIAASAGAACHAGQTDISHVLTAMQIPRECAIGTIRFSVGRYTTREEIDIAVREINKVIERIRTDN